MVRGLYTAASGALVAQSQADVIANNLANVNTGGFKRSLLAVQSAPAMDVFRVQTDPGPNKARQYVGALGTGSQVSDTPTVFEQGALDQTGNAFDLAIEGNGFFAVATPQGQRYTRDGQFVQDAQGYLVTQDGNRVMGRNGPIQLQPNVPVRVANDGTIAQNGRAVDNLRIVRFGNLTALRPEGDNRFADTGAARPALDARSSVHQGFLERSNANVVRSMVDLITAQRWFEANQKVIQTQDTANGYAIENVGRTQAQ